MLGGRCHHLTHLSTQSHLQYLEIISRLPTALTLYTPAIHFQQVFSPAEIARGHVELLNLNLSIFVFRRGGQASDNSALILTYSPSDEIFTLLNLPEFESTQTTGVPRGSTKRIGFNTPCFRRIDLPHRK